MCAYCNELCCDRQASKTVRASMGACLRVPIVQLKSHTHLVSKILQPAMQALPDSDSGSPGDSSGALTVYVACAEHTADAGAKGDLMSYYEADLTVPFALVIGSEAQGVSSQV